MNTRRSMLLVALVAAALALGACKKKGQGGDTAGASSSSAQLDQAYAVKFFNAAAAAFKEHRASGEKAAKQALAFVRANRAQHDQLKAYFKTLTMKQYLELSRKPDPLGQALMSFSAAVAFVKDMATAYKTKAWQDFTRHEQPRPGR